MELNAKTGLVVSVAGAPAQEWEPGLTTMYKSGDEDCTLRVKVMNVRDVDNPYLLARALFIIGSVAVTVAAGYSSDKAITALFGSGISNDDLFNLAKKATSVGSGNLASTIFEAIANEVTDIFRDWPDCNGTVLDGEISFQDIPGYRKLQTRDIRMSGDGCGTPNYELGFHIKPDEKLPTSAELVCHFEPEAQTNLHTGTPWWDEKDTRSKNITKYAVNGSSSELGDSPIFVTVEPERSGKLTVTVIEKTRDRKGTAFNRTFTGLVSKPTETIRNSRALPLIHQGDPLMAWKPTKKSGRGIEGIVVRQPDSMVSTITIPELDIRMELYKQACVIKESGQPFLSGHAIYYWRGYTTDIPDTTISSATLEVLGRPVL